MTTMERAILRAVSALIGLILFILMLSIFSLQGEIKELKARLDVVETEHIKEVEELEQNFEHKLEVYMGLCDAIIYGREEEW